MTNISIIVPVNLSSKHLMLFPQFQFHHNPFNNKKGRILEKLNDAARLLKIKKDFWIY